MSALKKKHPVNGIQDFEILGGLVQGELLKFSKPPPDGSCEGLPFQKTRPSFRERLWTKQDRAEAKRDADLAQLCAALTRRHSPKASERTWRISEARRLKNEGRPRPLGVIWSDETPDEPFPEANGKVRTPISEEDLLPYQ